VPNKLRSARSSGKAKAKPKPKIEVNQPATVEPEMLPENDPVQVAFTIFPPPLFASTVEPVEKTAESRSESLLGYAFTVINADVRGRVVESRTEQARFFNQKLANGIDLAMVEIPGGKFPMGKSQDELEQTKKKHGRGLEKEIKERLFERLPWETPARDVQISGFYLSRYEINQAQWRAVASMPKVRIDLMSDPSHFKGGNRPVEHVSWEEAVEFCERLSRATGRKYRLPTEAEWEYSCRAGTTSPYHLGDAVTPEWVNYHGRFPYAQASRGVYRQQTVPVGSLAAPNAFGLYDMHGNVWEWCLDSWHNNYISAPATGDSWEEDGISYLKVIRGGAWDSSAGECRVTSRNKLTSTLRLNNIGFRVVAEVNEKDK
jgi:formylglycine-generating enzyme required for sulfatase activity